MAIIRKVQKDINENKNEVVAEIKKSLDLATQRAQNLTSLLYKASEKLRTNFNENHMARLSNIHSNAWDNLSIAVSDFIIINMYPSIKNYDDLLKSIQRKINCATRWCIKGARLYDVEGKRKVHNKPSLADEAQTIS